MLLSTQARWSPFYILADTREAEQLLRAPLAGVPTTEEGRGRGLRYTFGCKNRNLLRQVRGRWLYPLMDPEEKLSSRASGRAGTSSNFGGGVKWQGKDRQGRVQGQRPLEGTGHVGN